MLKQQPFLYLLFFPSLLLYVAIGYQIARYETLPLFLSYFAVFLLYILMIRNLHRMEDQQWKFWIVASVLFRALLLFSVPSLSDDFYRFIWDGRLIDAGYHPFAKVPSFYVALPLSIPGIDQELFAMLNSKETFTIYPSFAQFIFWLSVKLGGSIYASMVAMKSILFCFEMATIWLLTKVLRQFKIDHKNTLLYALNPLVILELTGNLHFEGVMIFFLMLAILFLKRQQSLASSWAYAFSICTKLVPFLFMPLLFRYLGWKKSLLYWAATSVLTIIVFLPLLNMEIIQGLSTSLGYYFQRFEFNASIYYLIRELGYLIFGFNIIQFSGPFLAIVATTIILGIAFRRLPSTFAGDIDVSLFKYMLWCMFVYLLSATILHPWYIVTLLAISIFTPYRFPIVWTGLIFLSYAGYTRHAYEENLFVIGLEYIIVIAYIFYENLWRKHQSHSL